MLFTPELTSSDVIRQQLRDCYRADEEKLLVGLIHDARLDIPSCARIDARASQLVIAIRQDQQGKGGVDALLKEFSLSTDEGVVLMCLAEALLRIPDTTTIDRLIQDKLVGADWLSHIGHSESLFVNASAWGLLLGETVMGYRSNFTTADNGSKEPLELLKNTLARFGEPVIRAAVLYAMHIMGDQFVMGKTIPAALIRALEFEKEGDLFSYDMLGEGARTETDAIRHFNHYLNAITAIGRVAQGRGPVQSPGISVKLSALHPRYEFSQSDSVQRTLVPRLKQLALVAKKYDIGLTIDAEEADRLDLSLAVIEAVFLDADLKDWQGFGVAVQAYQKRALLMIEWCNALAQRTNRRLMVRLVKGAYWDSEIKWSQMDGLIDYPVFTRKVATDISYQACAKRLLSYRDNLYPQFATHNAYTVASVLQMAEKASREKGGFEFQRLHGMGESLYKQVRQHTNMPCRIYAPVGEHEDLLAYLVRRLLENGANTSFVNKVLDETVPIESLVNDPVATLLRKQSKHNESIAKPANIYGDSRKNSIGIDLTDCNELATLKYGMQKRWHEFSTAITTDRPTRKCLAVRNPANSDELLAWQNIDDENAMIQKLAAARDVGPEWSGNSVEFRAGFLRDLASALEHDRNMLIALCIKEAGKTLADAVAELREAVDFCRYYADQALALQANKFEASKCKTHEFKPLGVVLCISPWNFPLAIFLGQVAAALVVGNTVLAKPAEQTILIAKRVIKLMKDCGLPDMVVQLITNTGLPVGEALIPNSEIKAVLFTGSTATARWIARSLAQRHEPQLGATGIPLIAETGGQNAMIVDSTALFEQVVDDVVSSGFLSAGQRCSALRVLYLQEDVADKIIKMLKGVMAQLRIGDPTFLATDIGPVISKTALQRLLKHVEFLENKATLHYRCELPANLMCGHYFAPHLYEIESMSLLTEEVFGPVVHIIRYSADQRAEIIDQINAAGYGLTLGVHSRIKQFANMVSAKARVGNIYINRNMIGAVVGVQPFGGMGLSGTGPKAGGPHYLPRLQAPVKTIKPLVAPCLLLETNAVQATPIMLSQILDEQMVESWLILDVKQRVKHLRHYCSILSRSALHEYIDIAPEDNWEHVFERCEEYIDNAEMQFFEGLELPGPTGEDNQLYYEGRGMMLLLHDNPTASDWFVTLMAVLAAGNSVIIVTQSKMIESLNCVLRGLKSHVDLAGCIEVVADKYLNGLVQCKLLAAVIISGRTSIGLQLRDLLASRDGPLVPLINADDPYLLDRLVVEKTVTINTTATGGNASLMMAMDEKGMREPDRY